MKKIAFLPSVLKKITILVFLPRFFNNNDYFYVTPQFLNSTIMTFLQSFFLQQKVIIFTFLPGFFHNNGYFCIYPKFLQQKSLFLLFPPVSLTIMVTFAFLQEPSENCNWQLWAIFADPLYMYLQKTVWFRNTCYRLIFRFSKFLLVILRTRQNFRHLFWLYGYASVSQSSLEHGKIRNFHHPFCWLNQYASVDKNSHKTAIDRFELFLQILLYCVVSKHVSSTLHPTFLENSFEITIKGYK